MLKNKTLEGQALFSVKRVIDELAQRRLLSPKTNDELEAERQEQHAATLGTLAIKFAKEGLADAAGAFAANAFGKAQNAWRLRNPEPMMKEVHKFWLRSQGQNVDFKISFDK